jgi:hypothetical protein
MPGIQPLEHLAAWRDLDPIPVGNFLQKRKIGRSNYCINLALYQVLMRGLEAGHA